MASPIPGVTRETLGRVRFYLRSWNDRDTHDKKPKDALENLCKEYEHLSDEVDRVRKKTTPVLSSAWITTMTATTMITAKHRSIA